MKLRGWLFAIVTLAIAALSAIGIWRHNDGREFGVYVDCPNNPGRYAYRVVSIVRQHGGEIIATQQDGLERPLLGCVFSIPADAQPKTMGSAS